MPRTARQTLHRNGVEVLSFRQRGARDVGCLMRCEAVFPSPENVTDLVAEDLPFVIFHMEKNTKQSNFFYFNDQIW